MAIWRPAVTRGALLFMESLWVYAFAAYFVAAIAEGGKPSLPGAMAIVFISFGISRFLQHTDLDLGVLRIWGVLLSVLVFYTIIRIDFFGDWRLWDFTWADDLFNHTEATMRDRIDAVFGLPVLWAFWVRGVLRGQQHLGFEEVAGTFAFGLVVMAVVQLLQSGPQDTPGAVPQVAVPYVAVGLLAIGLSHAARSEDLFGRSFAPTWLASVGGAVLVLSAFALVFVLIDYTTAAELLAQAGRAIGWALAQLMYYLTWPIIWLMERMADAARWAFENLWGGERREQIEQTPQEGAVEEEQEESKQLPDWARLIIRILTGGSLVALLIWFTARLFKRFARRGGPGEVKESTYAEGRLAADVGGFIGNILGRLRPSFHLGGDGLDPARRLYFDMLNAASHRGIERRSSETPLELAPKLDSAFGPDTPSQITAVFDDVRYGGQAAPPDEVQRLRRDWESQRH